LEIGVLLGKRELRELRAGHEGETLASHAPTLPWVGQRHNAATL
jgi:hypothetical protein